MSSIFDAIEANDIDKVEECIKNGEDVNAKNRYEETPLRIAAKYHTKAIPILLKNGATLNDVG